MSLVLAATFAVYGLVRKTCLRGSLDGLTLELFVLAPVAIVFLVGRAAGHGAFGFSTRAVICGCWVRAWSRQRPPALRECGSPYRPWLVGMLQYIARRCSSCSASSCGTRTGAAAGPSASSSSGWRWPCSPRIRWRRGGGAR
ncbi:MAG: hypothetical protein R2695_21965 [Acidimicrobiales bacterium]